MEFYLKRLGIEDARALFAFELDNKSYFEKFVPPRGREYDHFEAFLHHLKSLLTEQTQGRCYFYLIKDQHDSILGRMNVVDIEESQGIGHLGYRVGKLHAGKGIASGALKQLLDHISEEGVIKQLHAKTTTTNIASQRVLEKNGFVQLGRSDESIELNGQHLKFVHYRWE
ncbi:GNAT family N-acetyltransferase [Kroppenstedtia pulmonis]|uniref:GNAT family N-acetyltransferase n=1 Tax=Kroppenstedtia pulmonis TaxID=1380685 RepID=A0A7D4BRF4_9BACL|nr:GNAT family N-acetyltransferase [Kroppenstedtia pulmonis]QKG85531.1 GNAT family N-acetyltransferase [Kroppenstedtia pulmonis]